MYAKGPTPEPVVKAIVNAIESKKPKTRQPVGKDAKAGIFIRGLIGDRIFDKAMLGHMNLN